MFKTFVEYEKYLREDGTEIETMDRTPILADVKNLYGNIKASQIVLPRKILDDFKWPFDFKDLKDELHFFSAHLAEISSRGSSEFLREGILINRRIFYHEASPTLLFKLAIEKLMRVNAVVVSSRIETECLAKARHKSRITWNLLSTTPTDFEKIVKVSYCRECFRGKGLIVQKKIDTHNDVMEYLTEVYEYRNPVVLKNKIA